MSFIARFTSECAADCGDELQEGQLAVMTEDGAAHAFCREESEEPELRAVCPRCYLVHGTHQEDCEG